MKRFRSALADIASAVLALATTGALIVTLISALSIGDAHAATDTTAVTTTSAATVVPAAASPVFGLMQGLVGLVIVVGLIYAVAWLMKKIGPRARASGVVQVIGGASVGPREKVVVVRFGHQTLLLGVAPGQVTLLHTADPAELAPDVATPSSTAPRFIDRLRAARGDA